MFRLEICAENDMKPNTPALTEGEELKTK